MVGKAKLFLLPTVCAATFVLSGLSVSTAGSMALDLQCRLPEGKIIGVAPAFTLESGTMVVLAKDLGPEPLIQIQEDLLYTVPDIVAAFEVARLCVAIEARGIDKYEEILRNPEYLEALDCGAVEMLRRSFRVEPRDISLLADFYATESEEIGVQPSGDRANQIVECTKRVRRAD